MRTKHLAVFLILIAGVISGQAKESAISILIDEAKSITAKAPATAQEEFGFSPEGSAEDLVLKFVGSTNKSLDVMAYGLTSQKIITAMVAAAKRGVVIRVVCDRKANTSEDNKGAAKRAITRLIEAGAVVRTNGNYAIHHDKVMISDGEHLLNGSFNFTAAAASRNSENVSVRWHNPKAAKVFTQHFLDRFNAGSIYQVN
jgi:phosphatidylserine/phosphatidylglycerophosphate/cardiolipin synthase-like enzyme